MSGEGKSDRSSQGGGGSENQGAPSDGDPVFSPDSNEHKLEDRVVGVNSLSPRDVSPDKPTVMHESALGNVHVGTQVKVSAAAPSPHLAPETTAPTQPDGRRPSVESRNSGNEQNERLGKDVSDSGRVGTWGEEWVSALQPNEHDSSGTLGAQLPIEVLAADTPSNKLGEGYGL